MTAEDAALIRLLGSLREAGYRFTTPTPATHARVNARAENREASDLAGILGWSRPFAKAVLPQDLLTLMDEAGVLAPDGERWRSRVRVSALGRDLFAHSAFPTVAADSVFFGPDTYRFGGAIEAALARLETPVRCAADLGCGAGPGAILVARAFPAAEVAMVDINDGALRLAAVNAAAAGTPNARPVRSDLLAGLRGDFDLIVSNPPYLNDPAERAYRHGGGSLGAALSHRIVEESIARLAPGGTLLLYTGVAIVRGDDPFLLGVRESLDRSDVAWTYEEVDPDVFGEELETPAYRSADRIAAVVLTVRKRGDARHPTSGDNG